MKICTIIGARPQFIKAAAVSSAIVEDYSDSVTEVLIHTGQHYDADMSEVFFNELKIPREKYNLEVGSGTHGAQTAKMLVGIESVLTKERPDWVLIYGDTNSTLAGALAAVKMHIKVAHVEAGMRSFNREMPEEINRIVSDKISTINFCSTRTAVENLKNEGMSDTAVLTGDVMYDCALRFAQIAENYVDISEEYGVNRGEYILMTCHRAENTDDKMRLAQIVDAVNELSGERTVIYPMHPRTAGFLQKYGLSFSPEVKIVKPVSYLKMVMLEKNADMILTDSGGVQKEAFFYGVPCVTMRDETEWVETVELGRNILTGADCRSIIHAVRDFDRLSPQPLNNPYGNGNASGEILNTMLEKS